MQESGAGCLSMHRVELTYLSSGQARSRPRSSPKGHLNFKEAVGVSKTSHTPLPLFPDAASISRRLPHRSKPPHRLFISQTFAPPQPDQHFVAREGPVNIANNGSDTGYGGIQPGRATFVWRPQSRYHARSESVGCHQGADKQDRGLFGHCQRADQAVRCLSGRDCPRKKLTCDAGICQPLAAS